MLGTVIDLISLELLQSYMLTVESDFITISLDPSSLNFAFVQLTFSSFTAGWPLLNGGPHHKENPSGARTERKEKGR